MNDSEIASLKSEIATLNKLITVLLEQNDHLRNEIAVLKVTNAVGNIPLASANFTNGNPIVPVAVAKVTNGNTEVPLAFAKVTNGNPEVPLANINFTKGNPDVPVAFANITNGNTENPDLLAHFLPLNPANINRLYVVLKKEGFNKVRRKAINNAAKLLLHFYNKEKGDYTELRKLTGLSNFGLAKYLRSLKKRGLIERNGWQQFKVTAHGTHIIKLARCEGA